VIGYGNSLRGDDGAGPLVARAVRQWGLADVRTLAVHQLTPELADDLTCAERALFVDARLEGPGRGLEVRRVHGGAGTAVGHISDPQGLLALVQALYDHHPQAWLLTLPAERSDFGEGLSPIAQHGVQAALALVAILARRWGETP
jgi:hydrogenase maturation protease